MGCINSTNKSLFALKRDDIYNVSVVRVQSDHAIVLPRYGFLDITPYELVFIAPEEEPVTWSFQHLRRYGLTGNIFSFEAGRRCPTGHGIYTFRCCNADQFYAKFQRCINSMSTVGNRSNISVHPSQIFGRLENVQSHTNHYLEPTSVLVASSLSEQIVSPESPTNGSNDYNLNSPDSVQSASLNAEILQFPLSTRSYSNVSPNRQSSNIYLEQPLKTNNEYNNNNNISSNGIIDSTDHCKSALKPLFKSSSFDVPPAECAPIWNTEIGATQRLYENIDTCPLNCASTSQSICNISSERSYVNFEYLPNLDLHLEQSKSFQLFSSADQQQPVLETAPIVNYIVLDLDQPRSPSQCSPKIACGSEQSLPESAANIIKIESSTPMATALTCGSSTMPKGSTISGDISKLENNKMESSGSYTRIDFLKTFALMKSSTNYMDFDFENDQESRITRHSKFIHKAYSISE